MQRGGTRLAVVAGVLASVVLAAALFAARSGPARLLPDRIAGALRGRRGGIPRPAERPRPDTPAVDVRPAPGIRITAPAGVLDRPREFTVQPLTSRDMAHADTRLQEAGMVALGGWRFDAGMTGDDLFHNPATVTVDLRETDIPRNLWDHLQIAHVSSEGVVSLLQSQRRRSDIAFEIRDNPTYLPVLIPLLMGAAYHGWQVDRAEVPKGDFAHAYWGPKDRRFLLRYPRDWPPRDPEEVARVEAAFRDLMEQHGMTEVQLRQQEEERRAARRRRDSPHVRMDPFAEMRDLEEQVIDRVRRMGDLYSDPEFLALRDLVESREWMRAHYLPRRVSHAATGLDRGWDYLEQRGFRRPAFVSFARTAEVFIVGTSMGLNLPGEARNAWTKLPFIVLDGTKIPDADPASFTAEQRAAFDSLQITTLHELFHVVQSSYTLYDANRYLPFYEASAVLLEHEAMRHYTQPRVQGEEPYAQSWRTTQRNFTSFFRRMDWYDPNDAPPNQQHGYSQSYFWEFLRDFYFTRSRSKDAFLVDVFDDFSRMRGGRLASLYRVTGGKPESLTRAFYAFTYAHADDLRTAHEGFGRPAVRLNRDRPFHIMRTPSGGSPLSVSMERFELGRDAEDKPAPVYFLSNNRLEHEGVVVRCSHPTSRTGPWQEIEAGAVLPNEPRVWVMRVENYMEPSRDLQIADRELIDQHGPMVFGLFSGPAPQVEITDHVVRMRWPPSALARMRRKGDGTPAFVEGYIVTLKAPNGRTTRFGVDEPFVELPISVLETLHTAEERAERTRLYRAFHEIGLPDAPTLIHIIEAMTPQGDAAFQVYYQELAAVPGAPPPRGPPSEIATFHFGDEHKEIDNITGTWVGRVPFTQGKLMQIDIIHHRNGDFHGTLNWGDQLPVRGHWNAATRSWALETRDNHLWIPMLMFMNGRLMRVPGGRLYLVAPPSLLRRVDPAAPTLDWTFDERDRDWQNLLREIGEELRDLQGPSTEDGE